MPPLRGADGACCGVMCAGVKPARQGRAVFKCAGFAGEIAEYGLRHILSEMRVAIHLAERRRINEIEMPPDQFSEGFFRTGLAVTPEQFAIGCHTHLIAPGRSRTAQERL